MTADASQQAVVEAALVLLGRMGLIRRTRLASRSRMSVPAFASTPGGVDSNQPRAG